MSRDGQAYPPVSIAAKGCQNVVPYWGGVRCEHRDIVEWEVLAFCGF